MLDSIKFSQFFAAIADDPRINTTHISLYMALLHYWKARQFANPIQLFSRDIMQGAKISSSATYHKRLRELNDFGYLRYEVSFKRNQGSKIYLLVL